jgi:hypothetical protein
MSDFWAFRTMVTPVIIQILFWVGVIVCLISGAIMVVYGASHFQPARGTTCGRVCSSSSWVPWGSGFTVRF